MQIQGLLPNFFITYQTTQKNEIDDLCDLFFLIF
jgi:hypothetical protein